MFLLHKEFTIPNIHAFWVDRKRTVITHVLYVYMLCIVLTLKHDKYMKILYKITCVGLLNCIFQCKVQCLSSTMCHFKSVLGSIDKSTYTTIW